MRRKKTFLSLSSIAFIIFSFSFFCRSSWSNEGSLNVSNKITYSLEGEWKFRQETQKKWHKATVPGCVHTDLMANGLIPDPYYRDNENRVQWVERENWEYTKTFIVQESLMDKNHVELVCKGIDTYAEIYLNDSKVADTDNMFRGYRFDIKPILQAEKNEIRIRFESPVERGEALAGELPYKLPGGSPHVRKAPYHFGWDWGPRLVTSGIWRPIFIEAWDKARIEELEITQEFPEKDRVILCLKITTLADNTEEVKIKVKILGAEQHSKNQTVSLKKGVNHHEITVDIPNPELWWPAGMGKQNLYTVNVDLVQDEKLIDSVSKRVGIRTLFLEQKKDQWGKSFQFVANGIPFFAKGANWIPADVFLNRVSSEKYKRLLEDCVEANMNMIRVWGGGIYEFPEFYDLCDELGITVWQDFMFACAMYPGDKAFLENVKKEAESIIKELRHHPCIALWCGNNECEEGWFNWGWKRSLPQQVWIDYEKIFHQILPQAVEEFDPQRDYWPSSPHSEVIGEPKSEKSGDMHYWGIWHGKEPFKEYRKTFHRFMSEFGFQSFPLMETVKTYALPEDWNITSPVMEHHQKHPQGNKLILHYMLDHFRFPKDFESLLWLSQVLQTEGMKIAVEHFRSQMPRIMGSLYWQLNDCWQVASWAGIDYLGHWKALHYYAKRFYSPVLLAPIDDEEVLNVYCISDLLGSIDAKLNWAVYTYEGKTVSRGGSQIEIEPGKSAVVFTRNLDDLKMDFQDNEIYFYCELIQGDDTLSSNVFHFSELKRVDLPVPKIESQITDQDGKIIISLKSSEFVKDVYLSAPGIKGRFTDNFFDMIPGKEYEVAYVSAEHINIDKFKSLLKIKSLRDTY